MRNRKRIRFVPMLMMASLAILGGCEDESTDADEPQIEEIELDKVELYGQEEKEILRIVARVLGRPENEIENNLSLSELRAGELEIVEIVSRVEERFQVRITAAVQGHRPTPGGQSRLDITRLTVADLVSHVRRSRLAAESP